MGIYRRVVLENTQGNHNKFYQIDMVKTYSNYSVEAKWGRIENFKNGNTQSITKVESADIDDADYEMEKLIKVKRLKGYKIVKDSDMDGSIATDTKKKKAKTQPQEHKEIVVSNWWDKELIEEREV